MRRPTQEQAGILIAMAAVVFGGWVRLIIPWQAGFPVNDGGLFYVMMRDLQANGLRIPPYVQYNGLRIPFAYPPLGFFVGAIAANLFQADPIRILQWLPAIVLVATVPAFYGLAKAILGTSFRAGIATLMFAFTPRAITWQIMGGGLTRSFGQLFLLLALTFIYGTLSGYSRKRLGLAILFSSLLVLSHPEAALQGVGTAILFLLLKGRSRQGALHAIEIGAGTLIVTAVWWLPTVLSFGAGTLASAAQTGQHYALALLAPLLLNFVDEPLMSLVAVFGVVGFALELSRRRLLVPLWFLAPFLIEPRSAPTYAMIPLGMLAGLALTEAILPALATVRDDEAQTSGANIMRSVPVLGFLLFVGGYMMAQTFFFGTQMAGLALTPDTRAAFAWIKANTRPDSRFLVVTGNSSAQVFCDGPVEWFPALTGRASVTTIQGREWAQGDQFGRVMAEAQGASACLTSDTPLECIEQFNSASPDAPGFTYLYVARKAPLLNGCRATGMSMQGQRLVDELKRAPGFSEAYENGDAAIFRTP
jgi:hypothetical protein